MPFNRKGRATSVWTPEKIKRLRERYGESQDAFCKRLRVKVDTLRFWEQGRGAPSGPAEVVFEMLDRDGPAAADPEHAPTPPAAKREKQTA